jgi:high-affinity nickel permease
MALYETTKDYLNNKPESLSSDEKEYINLRLRMYDTIILIDILDTLKKIPIKDLKKTEKEEIIQGRCIIKNRFSNIFKIKN